ncbi:MAG: T9SS type A sorting domain-containing protein [Candidatus Kapabacteria bacterium]|nr:T9SS type A sorting domain-containing protein [Candidatus Kapabacteria bacterium]
MSIRPATSCVILAAASMILFAYQAAAQSADCASLKPRIAASTCNSVCEGSTILLDAGEGYATYSWNNGSTQRRLVISSPALSGAYSCTVGSADGCSATTDVVKATVLPKPPKPYIVQSGTQLTATEGEAYSWFFNNKPILHAVSRSIDISVEGEYSVVVTNAQGCNAKSDGVMVAVSSTEGDAPAAQGNDARLRVYPNPTSGVITVQLVSKYTGDIDMRITDLQGKDVFTTMWQSPKVFDTMTLDISTHTNGTYILIARDGIDTVTETIIKAN